MKKEIENIFPNGKDIPKDANLDKPIEQETYLVDGEIHKWTGASQKVYSPIYTETKDGYENYIGHYPLMEAEDSLKVLDAAARAYDKGRGEWPMMTVGERINCMKKFVVLMDEQRDEVVKLLMWEIGKNLQDSEKEFDRTIDYIIDTIEALKVLDREASRFQVTEGIIAQVRRAPLGVVLCMGPFNYPLNETFTTLIPSLLMGNTVIFKPPRMGVLLHEPLLKAFQEAFPPGVVNTVYGEGEKVIAPLMESGKIDVLAFIGSSRVSDILKKLHPQPHRLKCVLGLEAKNPAIILPDADLDLTVAECVKGSLSYNGQRCTALKTIFVHEDIRDEFVKRFAAEVKKLKIGMPWDNPNITPLPEPNKSDYLNELINDAIEKGAKIVNDNGGEYNKSFFYPTVLSPVKPEMRIYNEEQFGPIVPIVSYSDIETPMNYVIQSNFGQQASIFGKDTDLIAALVDTLVNQVCRVNINAQCQRGPDSFPFTGRKDSAEGTLSVSDALKVFSIRTLVAAKENDLNKEIITDILKDQKSNFLSTDFIF